MKGSRFYVSAAANITERFGHVVYILRKEHTTTKVLLQPTGYSQACRDSYCFVKNTETTERTMR